MATENTKSRAPVGKSLWSDARRKLGQNRFAMFCIAILTVVTAGAFFTPLLPLQPSDQTITSRDFEPPRWSSDPTDQITITADSIAESNADVAKLQSQRPGIEAACTAEANRLDVLIAKSEDDLTDLQSQRHSIDATMPEESEKLDERIAQTTAGLEKLRPERLLSYAPLARLDKEIEDTRHRPYRDAGFTDMGPMSRWMTRLRLQWFGPDSIPSYCGRDSLGRDLLCRIFWGARVSLIVSLVATLVSLVIGVSYGAISGYLGGWVDSLMMRIVDVLYSVPFIFVVIFLLTILGEEQLKKQLAEYGIDRITVFYLVVGAIYWLTMARVVRGQVLSLKEELYVEAARALGVGQARIIARHIVPNVLSVVIVYLTLTIPRVMLFEAFLSFLGLGVESPDVSWGMLASDGLNVITPIRTYWWLVIFPSAAIGITLFALNFFGDALRDALDPKLRDT